MERKRHKLLRVALQLVLDLTDRTDPHYDEIVRWLESDLYATENAGVARRPHATRHQDAPTRIRHQRRRDELLTNSIQAEVTNAPTTDVYITPVADLPKGQDFYFTKRIMTTKQSRREADALLFSNVWTHVDDSTMLLCQVRRTILWEQFAFEAMHNDAYDPEVQFKWLASVAYTQEQNTHKDTITIKESSTSVYLPQWLQDKYNQASCPLAVGQDKKETFQPSITRRNDNAYRDLFYRDGILYMPDPILTKKGKTIGYRRMNVAIVIALDYGSYYGHVYTWEDPRYSPALYMQGIRSSVFSITRPCKDDEKKVLSRPSVTRTILEGVRQRALQLNKTEIIVWEPINEMPKILDYLGFQRPDNLLFTWSDHKGKISTMDRYIDTPTESFAKDSTLKVHFVS